MAYVHREQDYLSWWVRNTGLRRESRSRQHPCPGSCGFWVKHSLHSMTNLPVIYLLSLSSILPFSIPQTAFPITLSQLASFSLTDNNRGREGHPKRRAGGSFLFSGCYYQCLPSSGSWLSVADSSPPLRGTNSSWGANSSFLKSLSIRFTEPLLWDPRFWKLTPFVLCPSQGRSPSCSYHLCVSSGFFFCPFSLPASMKLFPIDDSLW